MEFQQELTALLEGKTNCIGKKVLWLEETDSTNLVCRRMAAEGAQEGLVVLAREQTAGRGRRGRNFQSTKDLGMYLSVMLRPKQDMETLSNLTAWVAVAVCEGVERACGVRPEIKWINDIILKGKKLGGILTEAVLLGSDTAVVLGIGINVHHRAADFEGEVRDMAASLETVTGRAVSREVLAAALVEELDALRGAALDEPALWLEEYRSRCITVGRRVSFTQNGQAQTGLAVSVDDAFALTVETAHGQYTVNSGTVSLL